MAAMSTERLANPFLQGDNTVRSLNRAQLAALPGVAVDDGVLDQRGYDLLSAEALARDIAAAAPALGLDLAAPDPIRRFDRCFDEAAARPHAQAIARAYGRRLGFFLLMLKRGEAANRAARPEWSDAHWAYWGALRGVILGGGLLAGRLGPLAVQAAQAVLDEHGAQALRLRLARHPAQLPLLGLARSAPPTAATLLAFDFGQTSVKRGLAHYRSGALAELQLWPSAAIDCGDLFRPNLSVEAARERWSWMLDLLAASWADLPARAQAQTALGLSLACYLNGGHPAPTELGCYGVLQFLSPHLESFVCREIGRRLGRAVAVVLRHDGTAAAAAYAGETDAIVLMLGTAIGNGFPPSAAGLWPLADGFTLKA